jgi:Spy/CpxP family protein refolding chaperone
MQHRQKLWASALLFSVFVAGAAGGGAATQAWGEKADKPACLSDRSGSYADQLHQAVTLTPTQIDTVHIILDHYQPRMHRLWQEVRPRLDSIRAEVREQIAEVLTAEQRIKYHNFTTRLDSLRAARDRAEDRHVR